MGVHHLFLIFSLVFTIFMTKAAAQSAGFSVVCDEVCNDWTEYQDAGGVIQTRSKGCTQKRTDPSKNIGGSVMNTARYPEAVKIAYEKRLKSIYCA